MRRVYEVVGRKSRKELIVKSAVGRKRTLVSNFAFNIGDSLLVVNDVIIGKTAKEEIKTYVV